MRSSERPWALITCLGLISAGLGFAQAQKSAEIVTGDARVDQLLSKMTLEEKLSLTHGAVEDPLTYQGQAGYLPGLVRLGIPPLRFADGPPGVLTRIPAAAPTCTMGVAATFSIEDAHQNGILIARQARSRGVDVVLQPFINMDRDLTFTRDYNTFGEDPLLTGEIGAAEVRGSQSQGVMCQAKHYVAFDTQANSLPGDVTVDQQTLHEVYVAPFADAVDAGVASLMCSYSIVNGKYSCGNRDLLITILRDELGFKGFVTSDWAATHETAFLNEGLDMEMPGPVPNPAHKGEEQTYFLSYFSGNNLPQQVPRPAGSQSVSPGMPEEPVIWRTAAPSSAPSPIDLLDAVRSGLVSESRVTQAAGRVLYEMDQFGYLSHPPNHAITAVPKSGSAIDLDAKIVRKTAEDAAVLLKNENNALPLTKNDLKSLAMIGPGARQVVVTGRPIEQARGLQTNEIGPLEALKTATAADGDVHIQYVVADDMTGLSVPAQYLTHDGRPGLIRMPGNGGNAEIDSQVDFTRSRANSLPANTSWQWNGTLNIPSAGDYRLHMQLLGAFGTLTIDGKQVANADVQFLHGDITQTVQGDLLPTTDGLASFRAEMELSKGPHTLSLFISPDSSNSPEQIRLSWLTPEQRSSDMQAAISAARKAKTAIVFAWSRGWPSFALPGDQDKLIEDVAAVNPNTIVVLNVSQPVAMPWLGRVREVLQMWWPGDEGGWATANILLGKASPAGRLPFTWPLRLEDTPVNDVNHKERLEAKDGKTAYSEGILIGYRWFDKQGIQPLFPFGYGLAYTRFAYSGLHVEPDGKGNLGVNFAVRNIGSRTSDEVPQVYLGAPTQQPSGVQFAVRALAAFTRIHLEPGESQTVSLNVRKRSLQYWSTASGQWETAKGKRMLDVGSSSRDTQLETSVSILP